MAEHTSLAGGSVQAQPVPARQTLWLSPAAPNAAPVKRLCLTLRLLKESEYEA